VANGCPPADVRELLQAVVGQAVEPQPPHAVIHGDMHFHNMCVAPCGAITGVFDLGDALEHIG